MIKIYDTVLNIIQEEIDNTKLPKIENDEARYYYFEGLKVAKQIVEGEQEFVYDEYAYEKLEEVVESFLNDGGLDVCEVEELVKDTIKKIEEE